MKRLRILLLLGIVPILSSCLETAQLEDLGVITARGVDRIENQEIEMNMAILQFQTNFTHPTTVVKGVSDTIKGARADANQSVSQYLVPGKMQLEIYGKELAQSGINPFIDTLIRDAAIPDTLLLAVAEEKARDIFHIPVENISTNLGEFLHGLIEPSGESQIFPSVTLHKFAVIINNEGVDPILPMMGVRDDIPTITGIALFKDDKMKGQLPIELEHLFTIMDRPQTGELLELIIPREAVSEYLMNSEEAEKIGEIRLVFLIEHGTTKKVLTDKEKLTFDTNIRLDVSLQEISSKYNLDDPKAINSLEKEVEKVLTAQYEDILEYLKEINADSFGYGTVYRINNKDGKLTDKEWDEKYPKLDVTFNINVNIIRHGTINK
ncbi:Ger(x)C family spore germination protein [Ornithinibacillus massiliensis]|uniref:Ger(X)C family spore germination protein n=2 Tax=Ornithinibacillus massiliensis TaxID=1944633 RepID=A0ABS5ME29_9BACI|nr:Ger(x)C family spore germination protein [Ornithinibacillus massiliensis]